MPDKAHEAYYAGASAPAALHSQRSQRQIVREKLTPDAAGIVIILVGLPARGKSFISRKLERFLQWRGLDTKTFNVGRYRRDNNGSAQSGHSDFYDKRNKLAMAAREAAAFSALGDLLDFLDAGGQIGIFDATNSTVDRRGGIVKKVAAHTRSYSTLFVEVLCDDRDVVEANMLNKVTHSPDFSHLSPKAALADLKARIAKYEEVYETVRDDEGPYIKLYNLSSKVLVNHCYGRIARTVVPYLMGVHIGTRPIWLVRAGAGHANPQSPQGSSRSAGLSGSGHSFAALLADFVRERTEERSRASEQPEELVRVFTSTMPRAVASAQHVKGNRDQCSALNALDKGAIGIGWWDVECAADTPLWGEVEQRHADFWAAFKRDPLKCRFPGGESYMDMVARLESLVIEVEMCTTPVLIVSHITVLQLLIAYFKGISTEEAWKLEVKRNTVIEAVPSLGGGYVCSEHMLDVDSGMGSSPPNKLLRTEQACPMEVAEQPVEVEVDSPKIRSGPSSGESKVAWIS